MLSNVIKVVGLAALMSAICLSRTNTDVAEKQSPAPQTVDGLRKFYYLSFVVQESENEHVINKRSYSGMMGEGKSRVSIRAGEKVPFASSSGVSTQYQQIDIGVSIDCQRLEEINGQISLDVKAEISSVVDNQGKDNPPPASLPIIRQNQWEATVLLPMKQPTVIFSSDDPASKHKMQLLLTVTPAAR